MLKNVKKYRSISFLHQFLENGDDRQFDFRRVIIQQIAKFLNHFQFNQNLALSLIINDPPQGNKSASFHQDAIMSQKRQNPAPKVQILIVR